MNGQSASTPQTYTHKVGRGETLSHIDNRVDIRDADLAITVHITRPCTRNTLDAVEASPDFMGSIVLYHSHGHMQDR